MIFIYDWEGVWFPLCIDIQFSEQCLLNILSSHFIFLISSLYIRIYMGIFSIKIYVFMKIASFFDYDTYKVRPELKVLNAWRLLLSFKFFQIFYGICGPTQILRWCSYLYKNDNYNFERDYIESIYQFRQYWNDDIDLSGPWMQDIIPFICFFNFINVLEFYIYIYI